jgi:hypothetical protein
VDGFAAGGHLDALDGFHGGAHAIGFLCPLPGGVDDRRVS